MKNIFVVTIASLVATACVTHDDTSQDAMVAAEKISNI